VTRPKPPLNAEAIATEPQPLPVSTAHVVLWGMALWAAGLAVTLLVPALRTGERDYWPWVCVAGIALGAIGYVYVRRGRGNASDAD
jgi:hypothetical protein